MSQTKNSFSGMLQQFMRLETNALTIVGKLSDAITSSKETVELELLNDDNQKNIFQIPSFGYLKNRLDSIDKNVQTLAGLGDSNAKIRLPDGTFKTIFTATIARDPDPIGTLVTPTAFQTKPNWFFANFLNPLLYVKFDISQYVDIETERIRILRLILNTDNSDKISYFDSTFKGKNDLDYESTLQALQLNNIIWTVDDQIVGMDPSIARYSGTFDVINVLEDEVPTLINGQTVNIKNRYYRINKLTYTDNLETVKDTKTLKSGDTLLVGENTKYLVESVDHDKYLVKLKLITGYDQIKIGVDTLEIYSPTFAEKVVDINLGFDERQIIFLKPIDPKFEIIATKWSPGIGIYSNELTINTPSGNVLLSDFYKQEVTDFGSSLMSLAKDKTISSIQGELPDAPVIDINSFKVVQINTHKTNTKDADEIKRLQSQKTTLQSEISNLDSSIEKQKQYINTTNFQSDTDKKAAQNDLDNLIKNKTSKTNLYTSTINDLVTAAQNINSDTLKPKYALRGFWPIPEPKKSDLTSDQNVIQFEYAFRYLRPDGGTTGTDQYKMTDADGSVRRPSYSQWVYEKSDIRKKVYNEATGFFEWTIEDVEDADTPNINQLSVAISQGEQIEFKVRSISEAGWPLNPIISDWSNSIIFPFPDNLNITDDSSFVLQKATTEESRLSFQNELNSKGLDLHLLSAFVKGDKYWHTSASEIASGYFDTAGNIVSLFEKIKSMQAQIDNLNNLISNAKGSLEVYIIDGNTKTKLANNSVTRLSAGFYDSLIQSAGEIATKVYNISIENAAASSLELISQLNGSVEDFLPASDGSTYTDYNYTKRKYDEVPITLSGVGEFDVTKITGPKQCVGTQTAQIKGQWIYSRKTDVGLTTDLYSKGTYNHLNYYAYTSSSDATCQGGNVGSAYANAWDGTFSGNVGNGGGNLTEFTVHKDHPVLKNVDSLYTPNKFNLLFPNINSNNAALLRVPPFAISKFAGTSKLQSLFVKPIEFAPISAWPSTLPVIGDSSNNNESSWIDQVPLSFGFRDNDKYLIGKRTCGAFLFLAPRIYDDIIVPGSDFLARKKIEFGSNNNVVIPLIFQFRLRDCYTGTGFDNGFAGGWNSTGVQPSQISLEKTVGFDILPAQDTLFSFDITVSCKLVKDTL